MLSQITNTDAVAPDTHSRGGIVEQLEKRVAQLLGEEAAVWLPTGTLANHLAVRLLAGNKRCALVGAESHLFNDSGDAAQTLSGLHLVPLAEGQATFALDEVVRAYYSAQLGRVPSPVGAISIETPVRSRDGEQFDWSMRDVTSRRMPHCSTPSSSRCGSV